MSTWATSSTVRRPLRGAIVVGHVSPGSIDGQVAGVDVVSGEADVVDGHRCA